MKQMYVVNDLDFILKVWDLAKSRGKKPGDSCQAEFDELLKIDPGAVTYLGNTEFDVDLMSGNLREQGIKVTNLNEIERQNKEKNNVDTK